LYLTFDPMTANPARCFQRDRSGRLQHAARHSRTAPADRRTCCRQVALLHRCLSNSTGTYWHMAETGQSESLLM